MRKPSHREVKECAQSHTAGSGRIRMNKAAWFQSCCLISKLYHLHPHSHPHPQAHRLMRPPKAGVRGEQDPAPLRDPQESSLAGHGGKGSNDI